MPRLFPATLLEFAQGQIGPLPEPRPKCGVMRGQPGSAVAAHLAGRGLAGVLIAPPIPLHAAFGEAGLLGHLLGAVPLPAGPEHPLPQIQRIGFLRPPPCAS